MTKSRFKKRLEVVTSASLVDAMGRIHKHRAHILDLVSPTPGKVLFGLAATITYMPYRHDIYEPKMHNFARLFYEAAGDNPIGKVLVLASNGHCNASVGGGTKLSRLHNNRMAGILTDGRLRDFKELARYKFVTYCNGQTTRWGGDELMPFAANDPVCVAGVAIIPGDFIYVDEAGAVVLPAQDVQQVFEEAKKIEKVDADYIEDIKNEDPEEITRKGGREI